MLMYLIKIGFVICVLPEALGVVLVDALRFVFLIGFFLVKLVVLDPEKAQL